MDLARLAVALAQRGHAATSAVALSEVVVDLFAALDVVVTVAVVGLDPSSGDWTGYADRGIPDAYRELVNSYRPLDPTLAAARESQRVSNELDSFGTYERFVAHFRSLDIPPELGTHLPYAAVPLVDVDGFTGCLQLRTQRTISMQERTALAFAGGQISVFLGMIERRPTLEASSTMASLSDRELELLQLLAKGLTNADISLVLRIGVDGVKQALKRLYKKLHVANRAEAVGLLRGVVEA